MRYRLISFLSYVIVTFGWALIWNIVLFKETYQMLGGASLRAEPIIPLGFVAIIIQGIAITYLFEKLSPLAPGLKSAFLLAFGFGIFLISYAALVVPAKFLISPSWQYICMELVFETIHFALIALVFHSIFKSFKVR